MILSSLAWTLVDIHSSLIEERRSNKRSEIRTPEKASDLYLFLSPNTKRNIENIVADNLFITKKYDLGDS